MIFHQNRNAVGHLTTEYGFVWLYTELKVKIMDFNPKKLTGPCVGAATETTFPYAM